MASKWNTPEKWPNYGGKAVEWWNTLSLEEKQKYKKHYENVREANSKAKYHKFPHMYDTTIIRISQLSQKHIFRIWVFREKDINTIK